MEINNINMENELVVLDVLDSYLRTHNMGLLTNEKMKLIP